MDRKQIVSELHKRARKNFKRKPVKVLGIDDLWHTDLMSLEKHSKVNSGFKYLLIVIDAFSKYLWVKKLKSKLAIEVTNQMKDIFVKSNRIPLNIQSDMGGEYMNTHFDKLMKKYNINHYNTFTHIKATFAERVIRTLREKLGEAFTFQGNFKWVSLIDNIVKIYNNTKHSKTKIEPSKVTKSNEKFILNTYFTIKPIFMTPKYKIGDFVRISKFKKTFEKSSTRNWSTEIFKIVKINRKYPVTYLLEDYQGQPILGQFNEYEIMQSKYPNVYLVDRIIKSKGNKVFVSWLGFDSTHNSWINKNEIS